MTREYRRARAAELGALTGFRELIEHSCREHPEIDEQTCYDLKLAVEEACMNVITHGYSGMDPGSIILELQLDPQQVVVTLTDFGHPFEPYEPGPPDLETNLENGLAQGFGLHFIYQTMDQIDYETVQDGNHLRFVKQLRTSRGA